MGSWGILYLVLKDDKEIGETRAVSFAHGLTADDELHGIKSFGLSDEIKYAKIFDDIDDAIKVAKFVDGRVVKFVKYDDGKD